MVETLLLAVALSMDAFAVSIGLGSRAQHDIHKLGLRCGIWFGLFQGVMPLIGFLGGRGLLGWIDSWAPAIACLLLTLIGGKMIFESFGEGVEEEITVITSKVMLVLAIATSIDAMAAGFSLVLLDINAFVACLIIAVTTFMFSWAGAVIGKRSGNRLESRAELLGGIVLILIGLKMLIAA